MMTPVYVLKKRNLPDNNMCGILYRESVLRNGFRRVKVLL